MVSSRGTRVLAFLPVFCMAVFFLAVAGFEIGAARAGADAGADSDRYAQKVASAVGSHHGEVKACYAVALERNPQLAGKFEAKWTIDTAGKPQSVHFEKPPADADFAACMVRTIAAWRFERAPEPTEVMFPFVFAAAGATPAEPSQPAAAPTAPATPVAPAKSGAAPGKRPPAAPGASDTRKRSKR